MLQGQVGDTIFEVISRRVVSAIHHGQTSELAVVDADHQSASSNLKEFEDANCAICMSELIDGSVEGGGNIESREMKCPGRHTFHAECSRSWFISMQQSFCPMCRYDFSDLVLV